jgi:hypothetical protein
VTQPTHGQRLLPLFILGAVLVGFGVWWGVLGGGGAGQAIGDGSENGPGGCQGGGGSANVLAAQDEAALIDAVYLRLTDLAPEESGLNFELGEVETFARDEFDALTWGEVATVGQGDQLMMTRHVSLRPDAEPEVAYYPEWMEVDIAYEEWEGKRLGDWKVAEVLERAGRTVSDVSNITHLSTVRVDVFAYGRSRIYKAAFLWMGNGQGGDWRFKIVDNITQGLVEASEETVGRLVEIDAIQQAAADIDGKSICDVGSGVAVERGHAKVTTQGYREGETLSEAHLEASCSCLDTCVSVCQVRVENSFCGHNGRGDVPAGWSMSFMSTIITVDGFSLQGEESSCKASYGCIRTECPYGVCETGVRIKSEGGQLQFAQAGETVWSASDQVSATCPVCGPEGSGFSLITRQEGEYEEQTEDQEDFD